MAKKSKSTVVEQTESTERKRIFTQGQTTYEIWATNKKTGERERKHVCKAAPVALASLELGQSMGSDTHEDWYVQKVSILTVANGQLIE